MWLHAHRLGIGKSPAAWQLPHDSSDAPRSFADKVIGSILLLFVRLEIITNDAGVLLVCGREFH